jgi:hypothetical protein
MRSIRIKKYFTEGCQENGPHLDDWNAGERYAHSMINDLNHNTSAWCDWNLFLDETGARMSIGRINILFRNMENMLCFMFSIFISF